MSKFREDEFYYGGMYGGMEWGTQALRDHEYLLQDAMYAYWSKSNAKGYQYLADCYNKFARKEGESPLLPPPAYL